MVIPAKFEDGVFKPLQDVKLEEGTIVEVSLPKEIKKKKMRSVRELGIFGIWAGRDDVSNGVEYVNKLRDNPRDNKL